MGVVPYLGVLLGIAFLVVPVAADGVTSECETSDRVTELKVQIGMLRLALKGMISECPDMDELIELDCQCTIETFFTAAATGDGNHPVLPYPDLDHNNATTSLFSIGGQPIAGAPGFSRGVGIVSLNRADYAVTGTGHFDISGEFGDAQIVAATTFVNNIAPDSIVLVNTYNAAFQGSDTKRYWPLVHALQGVGMVQRPGEYDSYSLVGYKPLAGLCGRVPSFIVESIERNTGAPLVPLAHAVSVVPQQCDFYDQGIDFEVRLISEGDNVDLSYPLDDPVDSPSLFFINGQRIMGATWEQGLNVVVLDPVFRVAQAADSFDLKGSNDEEARFVQFIDSQPDGSIVLISAWDTFKKCNDDCKATLESLGGDFSVMRRSKLRNKDAYSLIGYKGSCPSGEKPAFVTQGHQELTDDTPDHIVTEALITLPVCGGGDTGSDTGGD